MIDLVRSKRSVEGELDIRRKRRKFQHFDWEYMWLEQSSSSRRTQLAACLSRSLNNQLIEVIGTIIVASRYNWDANGKATGPFRCASNAGITRSCEHFEPTRGKHFALNY